MKLAVAFAASLVLVGWIAAAVAAEGDVVVSLYRLENIRDAGGALVPFADVIDQLSHAHGVVAVTAAGKLVGPGKAGLHGA